MWKAYLDPYLTVHATDSSSFLPVVLDIPNVQTSIHIALYLPTAGQDSEYLAELSKLRIALDELLLRLKRPAVFLRGDANSSTNNNFRNTLFSTFCKDYGLRRVPIDHKTYHHFLGQGKSDSDLDVLLYSNQQDVHEELLALHCKLQNPLIDSHHDLLISSAIIPYHQDVQTDKSKNLSAPKIPNNRRKIVWSDEGIAQFKQITSKLLQEIRSHWSSSSSRPQIICWIWQPLKQTEPFRYPLYPQANPPKSQSILGNLPIFSPEHPQN